MDVAQAIGDDAARVEKGAVMGDDWKDELGARAVTWIVGTIVIIVCGLSLAVAARVAMWVLGGAL